MKEISKQPPNAVEVEASVLGAMMLEPEAVPKGMELLKPEHFYSNKNRYVFEAMCLLFRANLPVDTVSVYQELKKSPKNDVQEIAVYISELAKNVSTAANIEYHSMIIIDKWILRQLINFSVQTIEKCYAEEDAVELVEAAKAKINHITDKINFLETEKNLGDELKKIYEDLQHEQTDGSRHVYKSTNFPSFNAATGGVLPGEMVVVSGKAKGGKTTTGLSIELDFFKTYGEPTALFTFEMPFNQYAKKNLSLATGTRYDYLRNPGMKNNSGDLLYDKRKMIITFDKAVGLFEGKKFFIADEILNDQQLESKIRYLNRKHDVKNIMVDYAQLVKVTQTHVGRKDLDVAEISHMLKRLTNELKLRTIVLSQENDEGKTAESKALEKDCDFWFSVSKPINEEKEKIKIGGHELKVDGGLFVISYKNSRHGESGGRFITYYMKNGEYKEIDPERYEPNIGEKEQEELPI
jgi:replicative DNA helicase